MKKKSENVFYNKYGYACSDYIYHFMLINIYVELMMF